MVSSSFFQPGRWRYRDKTAAQYPTRLTKDIALLASVKCAARVCALRLGRFVQIAGTNRLSMRRSDL
jgi:hypothetical protein